MFDVQFCLTDLFKSKMKDTQQCAVCREVLAGSSLDNMLVEKRGCAIDTELEEFLGGRLLSSYQEKWRACNGDRCNIIGNNNYTVAPLYPRVLPKPIWFPFPDESDFIYPLNPEADCMDPEGEDGNSDLCITCYKCSYNVDSSNGGKMLYFYSQLGVIAERKKMIF